jgi:hypothetical protein
MYIKLLLHFARAEIRKTPKIQVSRSHLKSQTPTQSERKEDTKVLSLKISFKISNRNKHAEVREKDTKDSGLKISFKISNTDKCTKKKKHQIKLQVSRSHFRSQI